MNITSQFILLWRSPFLHNTPVLFTVTFPIPLAVIARCSNICSNSPAFKLKKKLVALDNYTIPSGNVSLRYSTPSENLFPLLLRKFSQRLVKCLVTASDIADRSTSAQLHQPLIQNTVFIRDVSHVLRDVIIWDVTSCSPVRAKCCLRLHGRRNTKQVRRLRARCCLRLHGRRFTKQVRLLRAKYCLRLQGRMYAKQIIRRSKKVAEREIQQDCKSLISHKTNLFYLGTFINWQSAISKF